MTHWSRYDNTWQGVLLADLFDQFEIDDNADTVMFHCYGGYTSNVLLSDIRADDHAMLAVAHDGKPLDSMHGGPVRVVMPSLYFWKSAKWVGGGRVPDPQPARLLGDVRLSHARRSLARGALRLALPEADRRRPMVTQPQTAERASTQSSELEPAMETYHELPPIRLPVDWVLTDERFLEIAQLNEDLLLERTADGRLVQMGFPDRESERVTTLMCTLIGLWALQAQGEVRGEAGGYLFSGGPAMCPDVSWVSPEQLREERIEHGQFFFAPAFAVEVRSRSQRIASQQRRMQQWNGTRRATGLVNRSVR